MIKKLDISYYETSWATVCIDLEEKINEIIDVLNREVLEEPKPTDGKTWYFEGDELVIKKGKWVIDRYKKHQDPSSDNDRLKEEFEKKIGNLELDTIPC